METCDEIIEIAIRALGVAQGFTSGEKLDAIEDAIKCLNGDEIVMRIPDSVESARSGNWLLTKVPSKEG